MLLTTPMLIGGLSAFILDNSIPGSKKERGMLGWQKYKKLEKDEDGSYMENIYYIPMISNWSRTKSWSKYVPFMSNFNEDMCKIRKRKRRN
jgi:nucleobase transporter 1/2